MFQICVSNQKVQRKKQVLHSWILNAMIRNIKIHKNFILLRFQKSMESNKCIQMFFYENVH
jgi:hypothetical protein